MSIVKDIRGASVTLTIYDEVDRLSNEELEKLYQDITKYGRGAIKGGKHLALQDVLVATFTQEFDNDTAQ